MGVKSPTLIESWEGGTATAGLYCSFPLNFSRIFLARLLAPVVLAGDLVVSCPGSCCRGVAEGIPLGALLLLLACAGEDGISAAVNGFWPVPGSTGVWIP